MRRRLAARMAGAVLLAAATAAALTVPASAAPQPAPLAKAATQLEAMQRDLGLTAGQALDRLRSESTANRADRTVRDLLGTAFGGSHYDAGLGKLVVGVTDANLLDEVRAAGAEAKLVRFGADRLGAVADGLNRNAPPQGVTGWYVDSASNSVVLTTAIGSAAKAAEFVRSTGVDQQAVRVVESREAPRPLADVIGGNAYYNGSTRCSVGFPVQGGFVSAGHCGKQGEATTQPSGTFVGSSYPDNDYSFVQTGPGETPQPLVNDYAGGSVGVAGSAEAAEGASVCRSGSTSGWHCGTVQAKNQSVRYPQGVVSGLTRTDVCAEPGDSGGSFLAGDQAQGVTSGGSGNCSLGGTTYFQPVNEILGAYGLTLLTG
ncbi:MAG: S1 family peptidase [Saccharopolyspora sp.]|uniref:S1 family peptidase n=1 Tax=Saccharopolyspora TaxID=1835 RepID=UPI00190BBB50|nr:MULTISPECIES: S1 family peptidase [unclassified Saccharopolyspora]MBK0865672.1 S1 family peptidase [Saccharopolyspora sp. HNM0986]MBQ6640652.1 S1 family peptidase [Saccharopolyspora sp.]